jgi:hypothetical protein
LSALDYQPVGTDTSIKRRLKIMNIMIYTTAPEILDGPQTRPIGHAGFTADAVVVRGVSIELGAGVPQIQRYLEAGALVWTENEWAAAADRREVYRDPPEYGPRVQRTGAHAPAHLIGLPGRVEPTSR